MNNITFKLKNIKLYATIVVFVIFAVACVWVFINSNAPAFDLNTRFVKIASVISFLFCAIVLYFCIKIAFLRRVGLTINKNGITDSSCALSLGFVSWKSIREAKVEKKENIYILSIYLKDKEKYMKDENDYIARIMRANMQNYDCEVVVELNRLKCHPSEVEEAIKRFIKIDKI